MVDAKITLFYRPMFINSQLRRCSTRLSLVGPTKVKPFQLTEDSPEVENDLYKKYFLTNLLILHTYFMACPGKEW